MRYLVTGATGFIGINLVRRLAQQQGDTVICLVRNPEKAKLIEPLGVQIIYCDIARRQAVSKLSPGAIDVLFHCAGYVGLDRTLLQQVNAMGTDYLCEFALYSGVKKFVHVSSAAVISGNEQPELTDDMPLCATNPYGESKVQAERIVMDYRTKGFKAIMIRPCMVYGPGEPHAFGRLLFLIQHRLCNDPR